MDSNSILKISNKKSGGQKKKFTTKVKIDQGQLADSVTNKMMMNVDQEEEQPSSLIQQSITNSKVSNDDDQNKYPSNKMQQNQSFENDVNESELKDKMPAESPLSQSKINEIIYGNNYGDPAIQNEFDINQGIADPNMIENVGFAAMNINCPHCNKHVQSNVDSSCNCFTCFILLIMIIIFPLI